MPCLPRDCVTPLTFYEQVPRAARRAQRPGRTAWEEPRTAPCAQPAPKRSFQIGTDPAGIAKRVFAHHYSVHRALSLCSVIMHILFFVQRLVFSQSTCRFIKRGMWSYYFAETVVIESPGLISRGAADTCVPCPIGQVPVSVMP